MSLRVATTNWGTVKAQSILWLRPKNHSWKAVEFLELTDGRELQTSTNCVQQPQPPLLTSNLVFPLVDWACRKPFDRHSVVGPRMPLSTQFFWKMQFKSTNELGQSLMSKDSCLNHCPPILLTWLAGLLHENWQPMTWDWQTQSHGRSCKHCRLKKANALGSSLSWMKYTYSLLGSRLVFGWGVGKSRTSLMTTMTTTRAFWSQELRETVLECFWLIGGNVPCHAGAEFWRPVTLTGQKQFLTDSVNTEPKKRQTYLTAVHTEGTGVALEGISIWLCWKAECWKAENFTYDNDKNSEEYRLEMVLVKCIWAWLALLGHGFDKSHLGPVRSTLLPVAWTMALHLLDTNALTKSILLEKDMTHPFSSIFRLTAASESRKLHLWHQRQSLRTINTEGKIVLEFCWSEDLFSITMRRFDTL